MFPGIPAYYELFECQQMLLVDIYFPNISSFFPYSKESALSSHDAIYLRIHSKNLAYPSWHVFCSVCNQLSLYLPLFSRTVVLRISARHFLSELFRLDFSNQVHLPRGTNNRRREAIHSCRKDYQRK